MPDINEPTEVLGREDALEAAIRAYEDAIGMLASPHSQGAVEAACSAFENVLQLDVRRVSPSPSFADGIEAAAKWHDEHVIEESGPDYGMASDDTRTAWRSKNLWHQNAAASLRAVAHNSQTSSVQQVAIRALSTASPPIPEAGEAGWKMVPIEPTIRMISVGLDAYIDSHDRIGIASAWDAMLAASPSMPVEAPIKTRNDSWSPDPLAGGFPAPHFDGETQVPAGQNLTLGQMAAILVGAGMTVDRRAAGGQPASVEAEPVAWRWRPSNETLWYYDPSDDRREKKSGDSRVIFEPLYHQSALASTTLSWPTHRHKKRGTEYVLIGYGRMQAENWFAKVPGPGVFASDHTVDMREVAIYRSATDPSEIWVSPREEFEDGRFEVLE